MLIGTDWEVRVWEALLKIPMGRARHLFGHRRQGLLADGRARRRRRSRQEPDRLRGAVPPRHRQSGDLTGYHWGLTRKRAMLGWEAGKVAAAA